MAIQLDSYDNQPLNIALDVLQAYETAGIISTHSFFMNAVAERFPTQYSVAINQYYNYRRSKLADDYVGQLTEDIVGNSCNAALSSINKTYGYIRRTSSGVTISRSIDCCCFFLSSPLVSDYDNANKRGERIKGIADIVDSSLEASCEPGCCWAFDYLMKKNLLQNSMQAKIVFMRNYDHFVLLLGNSLQSIDLSQPNTWPNTAAILDPFAHNAYPANGFTKQMDFLIKMRSVLQVGWGFGENYACVDVFNNTDYIYNITDDFSNKKTV